MRSFYSKFTFIVATIILVSCQIGWAQDPVTIDISASAYYDPFDDTPGDLKDGQTGDLWWARESSSSISKHKRVETGDPILVSNGSLSYPGLISSGNKITVTGNTDSYFMRFTGIGSGIYVYASFILKLTALPGSNVGDANHFVSLGNNTNNFGLVYVRNSSTAGKFNIGIQKRDAGDPMPAVVWSSQDLDINTSYYIVLGAEKGTGDPTRGDIANLWINPAQTTSAPTPNASSSEGGDFGSFTGIAWVIFHRQAGNANTSLVAEIDEFRLAKTWGDAVTLPVSFDKFSAEAQNNRTKLTWSTFSEHNNSGFEVERSWDGVDFAPLTTVSGKGSTSEQSFYTIYDNNPANGVNYYRLTQIDLNGKKTVLSVASATFELEDAVSVSVYPNPVSSEINLLLKNYKGGFNAVLSTLDGREIHQQKMEANAGQSVYVLSLSSKPAPGAYVLKVTGGKGLAKSVKIFVQ